MIRCLRAAVHGQRAQARLASVGGRAAVMFVGGLTPGSALLGQRAGGESGAAEAGLGAVGRREAAEDGRAVDLRADCREGGEAEDWWAAACWRRR